MDAKSNTLNWFEVPVTDMDRAAKFYSTVFDVDIEVSEFGGMPMGFFPFEPMSGKLSGALIKSEMHIPSATDGPILYLNADPDLSDALSRVEAAGGSVVMPKTQISEEHGHMAFFMDTEGNRMAMHSQK